MKTHQIKKKGVRYQLVSDWLAVSEMSLTSLCGHLNSGRVRNPTYVYQWMGRTSGTFWRMALCCFDTQSAEERFRGRWRSDFKGLNDRSSHGHELMNCILIVIIHVQISFLLDLRIKKCQFTRISSVHTALSRLFINKIRRSITWFHLEYQYSRQCYE